MYRITFLSLTGEYPGLLEAMESYQALKAAVPDGFRYLIKVEKATNDHGGFEPFDAETFLDGMAKLFARTEG